MSFAAGSRVGASDAFVDYLSKVDVAELDDTARNMLFNTLINLARKVSQSTGGPNSVEVCARSRSSGPLVACKFSPSRLWFEVLTKFQRPFVFACCSSRRWSAWFGC